MTRFDECLAFVVRPDIEGGYSDRAADRGGPTNCGVTQKTYDAYRKTCSLSLRPVTRITADEVTAVYRTMFWEAAKCQLLPPPIDLLTFDAAVQHSPRRAVKLLQRALAVDDDGLLGPHTITAIQEEISAGLLRELIHNMLAIRLQFYDDIVDNDTTQRENINGWRNRIEKLRRAAT